MTHVKLRRQAQLDIFEAALWYEDEREGLGFEFEREIDRVLLRVAEYPRSCPELEPGLRRALVDRFPYGVYFVEGDDALIVLGVLHLHRHPETWRRRR